jgi:hypothetical protein
MSRYQPEAKRSQQFGMTHLLGTITVTSVGLSFVQYYVVSGAPLAWRHVASTCAVVGVEALVAVVPLAWATLVAPRRWAAPSWFLYAALALLLPPVVHYFTSFDRWPLERWLLSPIPVYAFVSYQGVQLLRRLSLIGVTRTAQSTGATPLHYLRHLAIATAPTATAGAILSVLVVLWRWPQWEQEAALAALGRSSIKVKKERLGGELRVFVYGQSL